MSDALVRKSVPTSVRHCLDDPYHLRFVRVTWVDYINFVRYRIVPLHKFKKFVEHHDSSPAKPVTSFEEDGYKVITNMKGGISLTKATLGLIFITLAEGFGPTGEFLYVPDPNSAARLKYADDQISIMGWFEEKECDYERFKQVSGKGAEGERSRLFRSPLCPRGALERVLLDAERQGVSFLIGFESEVIFLSSVDPIKAVNDHSWSVSQALPSGAAETRAVEEIAQILSATGLLDMYHAEAAPGQYEFVTVPDKPLQAVDALIFTRETIRNIASKHGLHATFAPRLYADTCGSAAHLHISLKSTNPSHNQPSSSPSPLSTLYTSFLQGLLTHLPSTALFTLPTPFSYARVVDGAWSGGTYVAWGRDNRETPVRLCGRGADDPNLNFEVKSLDGTANPYLAVAALLGAGMDGVKQGMRLVVGMCQVAPSEMTAEERQRKGADVRMPLNVEEARSTLRGNEVIRKVMGEELVEKYLAVNVTLAKQMEANTPEEAMVKLVKTY